MNRNCHLDAPAIQILLPLELTAKQIIQIQKTILRKGVFLSVYICIQVERFIFMCVIQARNPL